jgi:PAS domain S-box-containing protein
MAYRPSWVRAAFERSALAMILIDPEERIRCANTAAAEMLDADDLPGRSVGDFRIPDRTVKADPEATALLAGELDQLERPVAIKSASGRRLQVMTRVDAVTLPTGSVHSWCSCVMSPPPWRRRPPAPTANCGTRT